MRVQSDRKKGMDERQEELAAADDVAGDEDAGNIDEELKDATGADATGKEVRVADQRWESWMMQGLWRASGRDAPKLEAPRLPRRESDP